MSIPRNHHYVPQMYLQRFAGPDGKVHVFDGKARTDFWGNPRDLAAVRDFYQIDNRADPFAVESLLASIEGRASNFLNGVEAEVQLPTGEAFHELMLFVALLATRGPSVRQHREQFFGEFADRLLDAYAADPEAFLQQRELLRREDPELADYTHGELLEAREALASGSLSLGLDQTYLVQQMLSDALAIVPYLVSRKWLILRGQPGDSGFISCDQPVFLQNGGFGMKDSVVVVPLSPRTAIWGTFEGPEGVAVADREVHAVVNASAVAGADRWLFAAAPTFEAKFGDEYTNSSELLGRRQ